MAAKTQQDILDLFDRILPESYVAPLKSPGPGYEVLQAIAKVAARVSLAIDRLDTGAHILSSYGGSRATVLVEFYRATSAAGAFTVKAGAIVKTTRGGRRFITTQDAVFGALTLIVTNIPAMAVRTGFEFNVPGPVIAADGTILPGDIDIINFPFYDPPFADSTVMVRQVNDATGGQAAMLDQLGEDRGLKRRPQEPDNQYKSRIRSLPDVISPDAIRRALVGIFFPIGYTATLIETWEPSYQTVWDSPNFAVAPGYDPNLFVYDDPRSPIPFRNRWLDEFDYHGAFIVVVPNIQPIEDVGMVYDDVAMNPAAHVSSITGGRRAHSAYDVPSTISFALVLQGGYDGFDLPKAAVYRGLFDLLQQIKAAGVAAAIELSGQ